MNIFRHTRLDELKIKASLLLKDLRSDDKERAEKAARRFLKLPFLKSQSVDALLADHSSLRLKHALQVIALENNAADWASFRMQVIGEDCLFHKAGGAFLNVWFNNYTEAKAYHISRGGYLLRYRKDFAVCGKDYIVSIGLDNMDADWEAIEYDWVQPADNTAFARLFEKAKQRYLTEKITSVKVNKEKRPAWLQAMHRN